MQTFLPYADFKLSAKVLNQKHLGKQRVEAKQIINVLTNQPTKTGRQYKGWLNHPAVLLWKGYEDALKQYHNICIEEWINRGYKNTMPLFDINVDDIVYPKWLGNLDFHSSHRSNLLRKKPEHYSSFGWVDDPNDPYIWVDKSGKWYKQNSGTKEKEYI